MARRVIMIVSRNRFISKLDSRILDSENIRHSWRLCLLFVMALVLRPLGLAAQTHTNQTSEIKVDVTAVSTDTAQVKLSIPGSGAGDTKVRLNGKDVSGRFNSSDCTGATCKTATLTVADGLVVAKDVLTISTGNGMTARHRFNLKPAVTASVASAKAAALSTTAQAVGTSFATSLAPTVAVTTNTPGGWSMNSTWISVNNVGYPGVTPSGSCASSLFMAVVLDRQTLVEKTAAPESSPICLPGSAAVNAYVGSLSANDLVIIGSKAGAFPDAGLNHRNWRHSVYRRSWHGVISRKHHRHWHARCSRGDGLSGIGVFFHCASPIRAICERHLSGRLLWQLQLRIVRYR
jgi:hypothetical protein